MQVGKPWKLYLVSAQGGSPQQLIPGQRPDHSADWTPNGNAIVFGVGNLGDRQSGATMIQQLDLKTSQITTLPGSEGLWWPDLSPDGRYICAETTTGELRLVLFDFKTQKWVEKRNLNQSWWGVVGGLVTEGRRILRSRVYPRRRTDDIQSAS